MNYSNINDINFEKLREYLENYSLEDIDNLYASILFIKGYKDKKDNSLYIKESTRVNICDCGHIDIDKKYNYIAKGPIISINDFLDDYFNEPGSKFKEGSFKCPICNKMKERRLFIYHNNFKVNNDKLSLFNMKNYIKKNYQYTEIINNKEYICSNEYEAISKIKNLLNKKHINCYTIYLESSLPYFSYNKVIKRNICKEKIVDIVNNRFIYLNIEELYNKNNISIINDVYLFYEKGLFGNNLDIKDFYPILSKLKSVAEIDFIFSLSDRAIFYSIYEALDLNSQLVFNLSIYPKETIDNITLNYEIFRYLIYNGNYKQSVFMEIDSLYKDIYLSIKKDIGNDYSLKMNECIFFLQKFLLVKQDNYSYDELLKFNVFINNLKESNISLYYNLKSFLKNNTVKDISILYNKEFKREFISVCKKNNKNYLFGDIDYHNVFIKFILDLNNSLFFNKLRNIEYNSNDVLLDYLKAFLLQRGFAGYININELDLFFINTAINYYILSVDNNADTLLLLKNLISINMVTVTALFNSLKLSESDISQLIDIYYENNNEIFIDLEYHNIEDRFKLICKTNNLTLDSSIKKYLSDNQFYIYMSALELLIFINKSLSYNIYSGITRTLDLLNIYLQKNKDLIAGLTNTDYTKLLIEFIIKNHCFI